MQPTYSIIGSDGQTYGPVSLLDIKGWIQEGRISGQTSVARSDQNGWLPAAQYSELGFAPTAVPTPLGTMTNPVAASPETQELEKKIKNGAGWFFWIAGLSLINSISALSGGSFGFILGLGITQVFDAFGSSAKGLAIVLDLIVLGAFVAFGIFAGKKQQWAFIIGMILYALDGVIFLIGSDWLGVGFHAFALFCIFSGFRANSQLKQLQRA